MTKISTHLASRLFWLVFGLGLGAVQVLDGMRLGLAGPLISGLGFALIGVTGFMQPVVLGRPVGSVLYTLNDAIVGPERLRTGLAVSSFACLFVGLILKYVVKV